MADKFVKNEQLCSHYRTIGQALLNYEAQAPFLLRKIDLKASANLKVAISFISDSILDSYLEDLLDLGVLDKDLFIASSEFSLRRLLSVLPFAGLLVSISFGFYLSILDFSYPVCVSAIVLLSIPCALLWEWVPRSSNRRLFFARLIAANIANRKGQKLNKLNQSKLEINPSKLNIQPV